MLLWVQIGRSGRKLNNCQAGVRRQQRPDGRSTVPGRAIPQQQDVHGRIGIKNRLQMDGRRCRMHCLGTRDNLGARLEIQCAIEVGVGAPRIAANGEGLPARRPGRHGAGLQVDRGLIFRQNDGLWRGLGDVNQFFSI